MKERAVTDLEKRLLKILDEVLSYTMHMKMLTKFRSPTMPNLEAACRLVGNLKEAERLEQKRRTRGEAS